MNATLLNAWSETRRERSVHRYIKEGYYLYSGSHMGLAENRRKRGWVEVESTFRMLRLKQLADRD